MKTTNFRVINGTLLFFAGILCTFFMGVTQAQASWTSLGGPYGGHNIKLAMSKTNPDIIYAGTDYGGIYKSEDGGSTWTKRGVFKPSMFLTIQVAPDNPDIVYAGTDYGGIYKSEDGGSTWTLKGLSGTLVYAIAIDPLNPQILYITSRIPGADYFGALFKSTDGGDTWQAILWAEKGEAVHSVIIDSDNSSHIYLGLQTTTGSGINFLKTTDGGETWEFDIIIGPDYQNDVVELAMTPAGSSPAAIYAIVEGDDVYKSIDRGESWTPTNTPSISADCVIYDCCNLAVDPNDPDVVYVSTSEKIYKTIDAGDNWLAKANDFPDDSASIVIDPLNSNVYVGLYSGGIYKSTDGAESWIFSSRGLKATYIMDITVDPNSSNTILSAVYGEGHHLAKTTNNGDSWDYLWESPTNLKAVTIDPQSSTNILVGGFFPEGFDRSWDGGETWMNERRLIGVGDILINSAGIALVAADAGTEQCDYGDPIFCWYTWGLYWTVAWWEKTLPNKCTTLAAGPDNTIYVGTKQNGYVHKSTDGGYSWTLYSPGGTWVNEVIDIEVDLNSHVYAVTDQGLMKLEGYGMSRELTGLPADDIMDLAIDNSTSPGIVYAGTWGYGVYVSEDGGSTWTPLNEGLENLYITKLAVSETEPKMLYAGTDYGGVWSTTIPGLPITVLWNQPVSPVNVGAYASQDFEEASDDNDIFIADDFSTTETWNIQTVFIPGGLWGSGTTLMNATALHFQIYAEDNGTPDGDPYAGGNSPVWNLSVLPTDSQITISDGIYGLPSNVTLSLDTPIILPPGTYWLVFYPELDGTAAGRYGRHVSFTENGNPAQVINPGGGFAFPTAWTSVTDESTWNMEEQDFAFLLAGSIADCQGDLDGDGDVDGSDLAVFAADFGRTDCVDDCEGDFDSDGDVDGSDLAVFAADFGRTDCP